jgi:type I restriction enzyme M protein
MRLPEGEVRENTETLSARAWKIAEVLEQRFPGWDSRRYIIAMLIYRYLSQEMEQFADDQPVLELHQKRYRTMDDEEAEAFADKASSTIGFFIPPSGLFCNVYRDAPRDGDLGKTLEWVFSDIEESAVGYASESVFRNLTSHLAKDEITLGAVPRTRKQKLYSLMKAVSSISPEAISDMTSTFEHLLDQYSRPQATGDGRFEAQLIPNLLILLVCRGKKAIQSFYDPYCGTGVLLSHARFRLAEGGCLYGQSETISEYNMARFFMFLIHLEPTCFSLAYGDSLTSFESFGGRNFDAIVSILPVKKRWARDEDASLVEDSRFSPAGVLAPKTKTDLAYVMHSVSRLSAGGSAAFALGEGALSRERSEKTIRRWLLDNNLVDAVIRIPAYGHHTDSMHRHVLVLRKGRREDTILFIDASSQTRDKRPSFILISEVSHIYNERREVPHYACLVDREVVLGNGCDLRPFHYVESSHPCEGEGENSLITAIEKTDSELASLAVSPTVLASLAKKLDQAPFLPVGKVAAIKGGKNIRSYAFTDSPTGIGYVRTSDLACKSSDCLLVSSSVLRISPKVTTARMFDRDTVLIPKHATSIKSGRRGILAKSSAVDGNLLSLVPQEGVREEYLLHAFGAWARGVWLKRTNHKGVLRCSDANDAMIRVPPMGVQKQVSETIRSLEASERLLEKRISLLRKRLGKRLYELMLSIHDAPHFPVSAVAEVSKIPGYKYNKFVRYADSGACIALRGCNVKNGRLDLSDAQRLDDTVLHEISSALLHTGDILFTYVGSLGHAAVIDCDDLYYLEPGVALIRVDQTKALPAYLYYWYLNSPDYRVREERYVSRRNISFDRIRNFKVGLPPLERQRDIVEELETEYIARITESERALSEVHTSLEMLVSKLAL